MQDAAEHPLLHLIFKNSSHIVISITCMDNNWQIKFTCNGDLRPKTVGLLLRGGIIIKIIKSGFANRNTFGMVRSLPNGVGIRCVWFIFGFMRVNTNRKPDIVMRR